MPDVRIDHRVQLNLTSPGVGEASGKAILLGEHFVVHGAPALAVPVLGRRVRVAVTPAAGPWRCAAEAVPHVRAMVSELGLDPDALALEVDSSLPIGSGLGSSAALAVALVRALGVSEPAEVRALAHALERLAHGTPSGVDDAVVALGRPVWFEAGVVTPLAQLGPAPLWVATTPSGPSTKIAVEAVGRWRDAHARRFEVLLAASRDDAWSARAALTRGDWPALGAALDRGHERLAEVGVSTARLDDICAAARAHGAWGAKLTGAGLGGAALVLAPNTLDLEAVLRQAGAEEVFHA